MKNKASKKNRNTVILLVAVLFAGLSLLLYPLISNYWNSIHQSQAIATYMDDVSKLDDSTYEVLWEEAQSYNASLLTEGDIFTLLVLDETLTYEVDQIRIVEPDDISLLEIEEGEDLCTLVTCTPYGVNSHRLLVRGHRVENQEAAGILRITADAMMIDSRFVAPILAAPMLLAMVMFMVLRSLKRKKGKALKGVKEVMDG